MLIARAFTITSLAVYISSASAPLSIPVASAVEREDALDCALPSDAPMVSDAVVVFPSPTASELENALITPLLSIQSLPASVSIPVEADCAVADALEEASLKLPPTVMLISTVSLAAFAVAMAAVLPAS